MSGGSDRGWLISSTTQASGERNSMTPGARQVTWTRRPGLKPACSSQRPMRRIFGFTSPFQKSPSASIFSVRTVGGRSICVDASRTPDIVVSKEVRSSLPWCSFNPRNGQMRAHLSREQQSIASRPLLLGLAYLCEESQWGQPRLLRLRFYIVQGGASLNELRGVTSHWGSGGKLNRVRPP